MIYKLLDDPRQYGRLHLLYGARTPDTRLYTEQNLSINEGREVRNAKVEIADLRDPVLDRRASWNQRYSFGDSTFSGI